VRQNGGATYVRNVPLGGAKGFSLIPDSSAPWRNFSVFLSPSCASPRPLGIPPTAVRIPLPVWGSAPQDEIFFDASPQIFPTIAPPQTPPYDPGGVPLSSPKIWYGFVGPFLRYPFRGQSLCARLGLNTGTLQGSTL